MVYKYDYRYKFCLPLVKSAYKNNFNKIHVKGIENIPKDKRKPVIFAPNHKNAVVDGLNIVNISKRQIVFLARADIFTNKFTNWILDGVKVMPIYRIRDGKDELQKNEEVFKNSAKVLKNGNALCLFPEAVHNPRVSLLPLKKGIPRIALLTEASEDFNLDTSIVPVATHYYYINEFMQDVYIEFCKPINVKEYEEEYKENPNHAINSLRKDLDAQLRDKMIDASNKNYYYFYIDTINLCSKQLAKKKYKDEEFGVIYASQDIVNKLDELYENDRPKFLEVTNDYGRIYSILALHKLKTTDPIHREIKGFEIFFRIFLLVLMAPISLFALINTLIPILLYKLIRKKIKEKQFIDSIRIVSALIFVTLFYLIQTIIVGVLLNSFLFALVYLIISLLSLRMFSYWYKWLKDLKRKIKVYKFSKKHIKEYMFIKSLIDINFFS